MLTQIPKKELDESERLWLEKLLQLKQNNKKADFRDISCSLDGKISNTFRPMQLWSRLADASGERILLLGIVAVEKSYTIIDKSNLVIWAIRKIILENPKTENIATDTIAEKSGLTRQETALILDLIIEYGRFWRDAKYNDVGCIESIRVAGEDNVFYEYKRFIGLEGLILSKLNDDEQRDQQNTNVLPNRSSNGLPVRQPTFVNLGRLEEIKAIRNPLWDFRKLIKLCEELNDNFLRGNHLAVGMIGRAILDHVPPIFKFKSFDEVANNYGGQSRNSSFKKSMNHLNQSLRSIADSHLHMQIRECETLPNDTQIDFSQDLDVLLAEIVRICSVRPSVPKNL